MLKNAVLDATIYENFAKIWRNFDKILTKIRMIRTMGEPGESTGPRPRSRPSHELGRRAAGDPARWRPQPADRQPLNHKFTEFCRN